MLLMDEPLGSIGLGANPTCPVGGLWASDMLTKISAFPLRELVVTGSTKFPLQAPAFYPTHLRSLSSNHAGALSGIYSADQTLLDFEFICEMRQKIQQ